MKIAIDAMGGDFAPVETVAGALQAAREASQHSFLLVGPEEALKKELDGHSDVPSNIEIRNAPQVIGMNEHPIQALKSKRNNTISKCIKLTLTGEADAILSAGNTGAVMAGSVLRLGMLEGVKRAGIMIPLPTESGFSGLIDAGANLKGLPINFLQYAVMASTYIRLVKGQDKDGTVGLINVGGEAEKGTEILQQTNMLFNRFLEDRFIGNVEGDEIYAGKAQVYVCDGFVGNVVLKLSEGIIQTYSKMLLSNGLPDTARTEVKRVSKTFDYSEYGGAPLLGVNGVVIIAHGKSNAKAIAKAAEIALEVAQQGILEKLREEIAGINLWRRFQKWFAEKWFEGGE